MNEFYAAIAGAIVGGVIALGIQLLALRAAANERRADALERRKALGHALLFKMIQIVSHLHGFNSHVKEALARAAADGLSGRPWQFVIPLANFPERVHFSTDEMAMLLSLQDDDVFNRIASLDELHNSTVDVFQTYAARRLSLTSMLPAAMEESVGTTALTESQMLALAPRMAELDGIISTIRLKCDQDERDSKSALTALRDLLHNKIGLTYRLELKAEKAPAQIAT